MPIGEAEPYEKEREHGAAIPIRIHTLYESRTHACMQLTSEHAEEENPIHKQNHRDSQYRRDLRVVGFDSFCQL